MLPVLLVALAAAGPRAELSAALGEGAEAALACSEALAIPPWDEAARWISGQGAFGDDPDDERARIRDWLEGVMSAGSGLAFRAWEDGDAYEFRFRTELGAEDLARAFARVYTGERTPVVPAARGWEAQLSDGRDLHVEVTEGMARARLGRRDPEPAAREPSAVLASLPDTHGCAAWARWRDADDDITEVAAHFVPGDDLDVHFAVSGSWAKRVEGVAFLPGDLPKVGTADRPEAVLVIGLGLDSVNFSRFVEGRQLRHARWLQSHIPVTGGTTVAVIPGEAGPRFGAALPLADAPPDRVVARRLQRVVERLDMGVLETPGRELILVRDGSAYHLTVSEGRILLASDPALLDEMRKADGVAWVDPAVAVLTRDYPFVLTTSIVPAPGGVSPVVHLQRPASLAVTVEGRVLRGALAAPVSLPELRRWLEEAGRLRDRLRAEEAEPGT